MIEERKTHYSETKNCDILGEAVVVDQMRTSGTMIAQCRYYSLGFCNVNPYEDDRRCVLVLEKLVRKIS
ncbi:MAG: hypothetical protein Q7S06_03370 [Nanoarchaeota archaeon]|nr:hypothetical protein [Nanoarchaeota archaeon]